MSDPLITVCAVTGQNIELHAEAIRRTCAVLPVPHTRRVLGHLRGFKSTYEQMCFQMQNLSLLVHTPFAITLHLDGYGINNRWSDEFLEYDYIGAPWPESNVTALGFDKRNRVGNGGFTLRSRKWMEATAGLLLPEGEVEDVFCCLKKRSYFVEQCGCRIAPLEIAIRFSYENPIAEMPDWNPDDSFGFHNPGHPMSLRVL